MKPTENGYQLDAGVTFAIRNRFRRGNKTDQTLSMRVERCYFQHLMKYAELTPPPKFVKKQREVKYRFGTGKRFPVPNRYFTSHCRTRFRADVLPHTAGTVPNSCFTSHCRNRFQTDVSPHAAGTGSGPMFYLTLPEPVPNRCLTSHCRNRFRTDV